MESLEHTVGNSKENTEGHGARGLQFYLVKLKILFVCLQILAGLATVHSITDGVGFPNPGDIILGWFQFLDLNLETFVLLVG